MSSDKETADLVEIVSADSKPPAADADNSGKTPDKSSGTADAAKPDQGGEGNISFLLTALLLPLVVVGGIYGYAALTNRYATLELARPVKTEAEKRIEREIVAERAEVREQPAASAPAAPAAAPAPAPATTAAPAATPVAPHAAAPAAGETAAVASAPAAAPEAASKAHAPAHWGYEGAGGPAEWGKLDPAYAACSTGQFQSPIDIPLAKGQPGPRFDYEYGVSAGDVVNNGHTVLIKPTGSNRLLVNGNPYELEQLHFHTPSEHRIGGHSFPLEVHLVHKNAAGQRAVVGVMVEEGGLEDVLERLPVPQPGAAPLALDRNPLDLTRLLPENKSYFTFAGSLTTPPCSENIGWIVLSQPIKVPRGSIIRFQQVLKANNRPIQPLNGRIVYSAN